MNLALSSFNTSSLVAGIRSVSCSATIIRHLISGGNCLSSTYLPMVKDKDKSHALMSHKSHNTSTLGTTLKSFKSSSSLKSLRSIGSLGGYKMRILPIRALSDNYMYLLIDEATKQAACIDPVNASAMSSAVYDQSVDLKAILTTHHHHDHAGGNKEMVKMFPELLVYGGDQRIPELEKKVNHGDTFKLGTLTIECLSTPCHTRGHICYYVTSEPDQESSSPGAASTLQGSNSSTVERVVFTGDTLFIAGCGRFFEGTSEQMDHNLNTILGGLPPETKVYCGHEYTVTNLKFALSVEPSNMDIKSKLQWAQNKMAKREPTVPSSIGEEKKINPFMRIRSPLVRKFAAETDDLEVMSVLRQRKNDFQPT